MRALADGLLKRPWLALVATLAAYTIIYVLGQGDFVASDPLWYADIAHTLSVEPSTVFTPAELHPFVMRIGLTVPLSLLYRAFGVSTLVTNLPSLVAALGIVLVVYAAATTARGKLVGMFFCLTCIPLLHHGLLLNVDLPCAALMSLVVLCLSRRLGPRGRAWLVAASVAWLAAFLVKETAIWCAPVWLYAIVSDARARSPRDVLRSYAPALLVGAVLLAAYLLLCVHLWGSALARFQGVEAISEEHAWSMHGKSSGAWLARLTWQPAWFVIGLFQCLLVPATAAAWWVRGPERIWAFATATFLALYWFGSASLSSYSPLPISGRMILPVLPGILVCATLATEQVLAHWRSRWRWIVIGAVALALAVPALRTIAALATRQAPEATAFQRIRGDVRAHPDQRFALVCAEPRCMAIANFYFELELPPNLQLVTAMQLQSGIATVHADRVFVLVNAARGAHGENLTAEVDRLHLPVLFSSRHIRLYGAPSGDDLARALTLTAEPHDAPR